MKRLFFALTALAMLVTSCAKDNTTTPVVEGENVVSFKVSSPEMQTRYGEGTTANKLFYAVYQNGNLMSEVSALTADEAVDINITADVKIALVSGLTYDILFWAQNEDAPYVFDGKKVTVTNPLKANEEAYDAFFRNYEAHINGTAPHYVELYRPFAQLNIGTGDIEEAKEAGFDLTKTALTVKTATVLDLATGEASEPEELSFTMNAKADDEYQGFDIISMNYLLVSNAGKELVNIKFEAEDASGKKIDRSYMNVPLERNHKTYMLGNILTTTQLFNVVIIPAFDGELPETAEEKLLMAAQMGGEVTLEEDITVSTSIIVTRDFVLNLNGKTITNKVDNTATDVIVVEEGATLTINGEGNVEAVSGNDGYAVISEGTVIINGGTFKAGVDATNDGNCTIYARGKGKVYINGGNFSTPAGDDTTYVLNKKDADRETTTIEVKGGTFHNFNPANNPAEGDGTNFVAEGYFSSKIGEDYVVSDSIIVSTDEALNAALALDLKNIPIVLAADLNANVSEGSIKWGGANTETITIDGDGHTLTLIKKNSDWNKVFMNNEAGKLILNDMTLTCNKNGNDAWNNYTVGFDCVVEMNEVDMVKGVCVRNDAAFNDVTITEANGMYALYVTAAGQTVTIDGMQVTATNGGRGIKVIDEYMAEADLASVTLNIKNASFATEKKAAVLVTSKAGAVINWGEGNDISQVTADTEFAVWVDDGRAAYANKVVVNGAYSKVEGTTAAIVEANSNETLADEIKNSGAEVVVVKLAAGSYIIPDDAQGKTMTIYGTGNPADVVIASQDDGAAEGDCDYSFDGATVTFNDVTITTSTTYFPGYARMKGTYNNCIINGVYTTYDNSTFNDCTFNVSGNVYNLWTWGAVELNLNNCTFNCDGKAVLLYGQVNTKLTVNDCTFNDNGGLADLKAAIEIGNDYNKSYTLIVNNATVNGFEINDKGINTGSTLWANKNSMGSDKLNVVIDGVDIY